MRAGTFKARAVDWALGFTGEGAPQVAVAFLIIGGDCDGEQITWYGYFTEKTERRTLESLRVCGWKGDDLADLAGLGDDEVALVVKEDVYQGETRLKVAWVNRPGGLVMKARMNPEEAKRFAKQMMGAIVAARSGAPISAKGNGASAPRSAAAGGQVPFDEDEIPY